MINSSYIFRHFEFCLVLINNHDKNDRMKNGVQNIEPFIWAQKVPDDKYLEEEHQ